MHVIITHTTPTSVLAALEVQTTTPPHQNVDDTHSNSESLLHGSGFAKPIPELGPDVQKLIDAVMALAPRYSCLKSALRTYLTTSRPLSQIAREHSYTATALAYWIHKLGLPRRRRGRRVLLVPTEQHRRIIALAREHGAAEAARHAGVSKQRISQIVLRWAPELRGRRRVRKIVALPRPKRGSPRNIIVSFRISSDEWQRLLSTEPTAEEVGLLGFEKARAIVLNYLGQSGGDCGAPAQASPAPTQDTQSLDAVNVYNQAAA